MEREKKVRGDTTIRDYVDSITKSTWKIGRDHPIITLHRVSMNLDGRESLLLRLPVFLCENTLKFSICETVCINALCRET